MRVHGKSLLAPPVCKGLQTRVKRLFLFDIRDTLLYVSRYGETLILNEFNRLL